MSRRCNLLIFVAAAMVVLVGVRYAQPFLVPVLFGASLAAISSPVATWVTRRGLPSAVGALAALLVDVALLAFMGTMLVLAGNELQTRMPAYMVRLAGVVVPLAAALSRWGIPVNAEGLSSALHVDGMFSMLGDAAMEVAGVLSSLAMVLLIVFFTLCEFTGVGDKISLLTRDRDGALVRIDRIVRQVQRYLVVKTLTSFGVALLAFILLRCFRVDVALLLALVLFLLRFIPNVGAVVGTIPALLVAFASRGPGTAVAVGLGYVLINVLVGNVVESRVLGRTLGLSPLVVLLGMLFWGWLWGASGALLSVPLMMVGKIILENSKDLAWIARLVEPAPDARERALPHRSPTNPLMTRSSVPIGLGSSVREPAAR